MQANARMGVIDEDMAVIDRRCPALNCWSDLQVVHIPHQPGRWPPPTVAQAARGLLGGSTSRCPTHRCRYRIVFGAVMLGITQPQVAGAK